MEVLQILFERCQSAAAEIAPYFEGYFGEHISRYPGCNQLDNKDQLRFFGKQQRKC